MHETNTLEYADGAEVPASALASLTADAITSLTAEQAWHYRVIPLSASGAGALAVASALGRVDKPVAELRRELRLVLGRPVTIVGAPAGAVGDALARYYRVADAVDVTRLEGRAVLDALVTEALAMKASDIHIEAYETYARVRFRVDGRLIQRHRLPPERYLRIVSAIKVQADLDISQRRLPQDGRIGMQAAGGTREVDLRVSTTPALFGEKVVIRLLGADALDITLPRLGMSPTQLALFRLGINRHSGIVLVSGPTGSGKTTTLYAALETLNDEGRNVSTLEDPVEYTIDGVNQVQLNPEIGLTFERGLRSFLRQDPDVIMVGEIRDRETAEMAIRASMTGHLVLSTIHTNSALGIVDRLVDIGIPRHNLAATLNTLVAQRLVRRLCAACKRTVATPAPATLDGIEIPWGTRPATHAEAVGCDACYFTGYAGRLAVHEVIDVDLERRGVIRGAGEPAQPTGGETLLGRLEALLATGETSVAEALPTLISYAAR